MTQIRCVGYFSACIKQAPPVKRGIVEFSLLALDKLVDNPDKRLYMRAKSLIYKDKAYDAQFLGRSPEMPCTACLGQAESKKPNLKQLRHAVVRQVFYRRSAKNR